MFLVSHYRPVHELVFPHLADHATTFEQQFAGMTDLPFTYETYEETRRKLVVEIHKMLSNKDKKFLISFEQGNPDWDLIPIENLKDLPAVKWKLQNIQKLRNDNPEKHAAILRELTERLKV